MNMEETLLFKPNVTETSRTLDLSSIVHKLGTYSKNTIIFTKTFFLDDLEFIIMCYPNGSSQSGRNNTVGIYLSINPDLASENDYRNLYFSMECGHRKLQFVNRISPGLGWPDAFSHSDVQQSPTIQCTMKLTHNPVFIQKIPSHSLKQHGDHMSASHGDITLIIKLPKDNVSDILHSPPPKRTRLNQEFECVVCNKPFTNNKTLQSHQSNKTDEAHTNYTKNHNNNHNNADSLECDEIKISSVILRSASKVFDRMLSANMVEKQQKTIEIHAQSVDDVKDMVYYMSTNILRRNSDPFALIELAHFYSMDRLFWECVNRIISGINIQNFAQSVITFTKYEIEDGYASFVEFAKQNVEELKAMPDFENIPFIFKCLVFKKPMK